MRLGHPWEPADELAYIRGLGRWSSPVARRGMTRRQLLEQYLETLPQRARWGELDPVVVEQAVREALAALPELREVPPVQEA
jgi:hypothetical protein